eukprot:gene12326-biopygen4932
MPGPQNNKKHNKKTKAGAAVRPGPGLGPGPGQRRKMLSRRRKGRKGTLSDGNCDLGVGKCDLSVEKCDPSAESAGLEPSPEGGGGPAGDGFPDVYMGAARGQELSWPPRGGVWCVRCELCTRPKCASADAAMAAWC